METGSDPCLTGDEPEKQRGQAPGPKGCSEAGAGLGPRDRIHNNKHCFSVLSPVPPSKSFRIISTSFHEYLTGAHKQVLSGLATR